PYGCVVEREGDQLVFVGGTLIAQYDSDDRDRGPRNVLLVTLAKVPSMHLGHLAAAFELSEEYLRELRRLEEAGGLAAVLKPAAGGKWRITDEKRAELHALFAAGWNVSDATRRQRRGKSRVSRATVSREFHRWKAARDSAAIAAPVATAISTAEQLTLFATSSSASVEVPAATATTEPNVLDDVVAVAADEEDGAVVTLKSRPVAGGNLVQHVGAWIALALAKRDGLHDEVQALGGSGDHLAIALDAAITSLAIGQHTLEGVRRLATPTAPQLLRADHTPTANTVRQRLWQLAKDHGAELMARMSRRYVGAARADDDSPAIFYVDNHLRPYTGKQVVRKGWRMQDRRVLPGTSDYYVHDEDGRPVLRVDVPSHDSLCTWLLPIAQRLRDALGKDERILLAFDRAGSFPEEIATLRDAGVELVVYERKPYALLADSDFDRTIEIRGDKYRWCEQRLANLGAKRGRVRRISLRTADGNQINLLAHSKLGPEDLIGILLGREAKDDPSGRWQQENAFKHGIERWGQNQLDSRKTELYPSGTIIPNPRRRRIERALTIARADEGRARCKLAELAALDNRRDRVEADLADAIHRRVHLELMRPLVPKRAPVEDTELAGKLVFHTAERKAVVDTIRIVCANIEADLAEMIAPHLRRPREAKKVIANLFAAPGRVDVTPREIRVRLAIAANRSERAAIRRLLAELTGMRLTLPRDGSRRSLRIEVQPS
ncbi:MAG: putative transposase, partial [Polyangiaceae bacterium]